MPVAIELASPWWLLSLPPIAVLLVVARLPWFRRAAQLGSRWSRTDPALAGQSRLRSRLDWLRQIPRAEALRLGIRLGWATLLVLALAGATLSRPLHQQALILVLDSSASMAPVRDQVESAARTALAHLGSGDLAGVVAVTADARVEEAPDLRPLFNRLGATPSDNSTDLAAGLRLAGALVPEGYTGRVVVESDGRQTRGDAIAVARDLAARGISVDTLPIGAAAGADLRLEAVDLPDTAYRGEVSTLTARIIADRVERATLRVYRDDQLILERGVDLRPGRQDVAVPISVGDPGLHRYRVDLAAADPAADSITANNALGAIQRVNGPPRVLVVSASAADAGLLPGAFQAGGAEVSVVQPAGVPADLAGWARYDAVVLADVPAEALPTGAMDLLEGYVRDLGRGLVMTGGPESFGPGAYADTPVERALPVYMDLRGRGRQPKVALALVIDKSGSMSGVKMEMAKEAAARSIRLLRADDRAAVLAFDSVPQWVAGLTPLSERERLEQAIGSIYAGGGTEIYPALAEAFASLRDIQADVKHIILLTDGQSATGGDYARLLQQLREARVSLSTVAVGDDADTGLLEAMARAGRGRYHFAADAESIPQIFAKETIMATRSILVDERFYPAAASSSPLLRGVNAVPPLDGYVAVTPKERAEVVLVSPEGDPVLAAWQYGIGRAIAWTPDVAGRWSGAWAQSPSATVLWGNALSWLLPAREGGDLGVRVEADGNSASAVVAENRGDWDQVRPTRATVLGPDGQRQNIDLAPAGPGRYRAPLERMAPGAYVVQVTQAGDNGAQLRGEAGWVAPYPAEYRETGIDRAFLARLAEAGGGHVLSDPAEAARPADRPATARWPLWPLLLIVAGLLWPLEIASRRLAIFQTAVGVPVLQRQTGASPADATVPETRSRRPSPSTPEPAAQTTQRLLERKRAYRERQQ